MLNPNHMTIFCQESKHQQGLFDLKKIHQALDAQRLENTQYVQNTPSLKTFFTLFYLSEKD